MIRKFYYGYPNELGGHLVSIPIEPEIKPGQVYSTSAGNNVIINAIYKNGNIFFTRKKGEIENGEEYSKFYIHELIDKGFWKLITLQDNSGSMRRDVNSTEFDDFIPQAQSVVKTQEVQLRDGILAAIKITNGNLINMERKLIYRTRKYNNVDRVLLQSESLSIFKGNVIRIFKQVYSSHMINRIKRSICFVLDLDDVHPVVRNVTVKWLDNIEWLSKEMEGIQMTISTSFANLTYDDISQMAIQALAEAKDEDLQPNPIEKSLLLKDINFDTIKNIKFV